MIIQNEISKLDIQRMVYVNKLIHTKKIEVNRQELEDIKSVRELLKGYNLNTHYAQCNRKSKKMAERLGIVCFWENKEKLNSKILFTPDQAVIYFVLLNGAILHNSLISVWCEEGVVNFTEQEKVILYEEIRKNIYRCKRIISPGRSPYIDQWLQVMDVQLNYTISMRKLRIKAYLEEIRIAGMEKQLDDIQNLLEMYIKEATEKSVENLEWAIDYGECFDKLMTDSEDSCDEERDEDCVEDESLVEYEQRNDALRKYVKSDAKGSEIVLKKKSMSREEVLRLLKYL